MAIQEEVLFEGGPHRADLIVNIILTIFPFPLIWLPFLAGAAIRHAFTKYRFTNRRITVEGGWMGRNRTDVIYREVAQVKPVPTTIFGSIFGYGVLLIVLRDGSKLELKAVPKFRELATMIEERITNYNNKDKKPQTATNR